MANSIIQVPPDSTGKKVDTESLTVGANTVERQRVQVAGAAASEISVVTNAAPGATDYGLAVRQPKGAVDANNSSTTPLGISGVFTGTYTDVLHAGAVIVSVFADTAGASNGLQLQWSSNGANLDFEETATIAAAVGQSFVLAPRAQFFRLVYTNGGTAQAAFRLETLLLRQAATERVRVISALPAGTNAIGKLAANSGVDIGDVDVTSLPALPAGTNNIGDVDVVSMPALPAGTNNIGDVDVVSLPPLPAGTNNIGDVDVVSMPALPAGTNNIGDVDVVSLPPLPAGTNAIGKLAANSGVDIGDVDVTSLPALPAGTNNIGDVDVLTVPAPLNVTGGGTEAAALRVTVANDSTGLISVDDNGGSLTVDVGTALPAGANNIGDVDVLSVVPGTAATNLGKAIDSVSGATDTGVVALAVRDDSLATLTPIDGDYTQLRVNSQGALHVTGGGGGTEYTEDVAAAADPTGGANILVRQDTPAGLTSANGDNVAQRGTNFGAGFVQVVTSSGAFVDTFGGSGGTAQADESAFTEGTTSMTPVGGVLNDTITSDPTEDQAAAVRITAKRAFHTNLRSVAGTEIGTSSDPIRIDTTGTTTQPVSGTVTANAGTGDFLTVVGHTRNEAFKESAAIGGELDDTSPVAATEGNVSPVRITAQRGIHTNLRSNAGTEIGTSTDPVRTDPTGTTTQPVSGTVNIGTFPDNEPFNVAQWGGTAAGNGGTAGAPAVGGIQAHDAALAGNNPVLIGASMETMADSAPSSRAGADADLNRLATTDGALFVIPTGPQTWSYHADGSTALTDATVHAAPGAGLSLYVTDIVASLGAATALNVFFEEGASRVLGPWYLEAINGRGLVVRLQTPKKITANTALTVTTSAAVAHAVDVTGFIAPG